MAEPGAQVLRAATVLGAAAPLSPGEIVVEGGVITAVRALSAGRPPSDNVLAPGFVDLQVNGIGDVDVATASDDAAWERLDERLLAQGVTTWCPTLTTAAVDDLEARVERVAEHVRRRRLERGPRPDPAGVHLEGPFLSVPGAHPPEHLRPSVDRNWLSRLPGEVALVTLAPELPGALDAIGDLVERGVLVSLGHSACTYEEAVEGAARGARMVTHLGNASGLWHQRRPGLLGAALTDPSLAVGVIADHLHLHPAVLRLAFAAKGPTGVALVTDAVALGAGHVGPVELRPGGELGPGRTPRVARLADGTLAGSLLTMPEALSNVMTDGISLPEAVQAAATTPARLLGATDRGCLAPGRRADIVELAGASGSGVGHDPSPKAPRLTVRRVWVGGALAWTAPSTP